MYFILSVFLSVATFGVVWTPWNMRVYILKVHGGISSKGCAHCKCSSASHRKLGLGSWPKISWLHIQLKQHLVSLSVDLCASLSGDSQGGALCTIMRQCPDAYYKIDVIIMMMITNFYLISTTHFTIGLMCQKYVKYLTFILLEISGVAESLQSINDSGSVLQTEYWM